MIASCDQMNKSLNDPLTRHPDADTGPPYKKTWARMGDLYAGERGWRQLDTGGGHWDDQTGEEGGRTHKRAERKLNMGLNVEAKLININNKTYQLPSKIKILSLSSLLNMFISNSISSDNVLDLHSFVWIPSFCILWTGDLFMKLCG